MYTDPRTVLSPKGTVKNLEVLYDGGENGWSLARMTWGSSPVMGMRWNGGSNNGEPSIGTPNARGYSTWFVLPAEVGDAVETMLRFKKKISG
jgi:hypothetical protein